MVERSGRFGKFLACPGYPECKNTKPMPENEIKEPENEWVFDEIHNKEEAMAWIKSYNQRNKIRGHIPENEETIKMRLLAIRSDLNKKTRSK